MLVHPSLSLESHIVSEENRPGAVNRTAQPLDLTKYTLTSPTEIVQHLKGIADHGYMATVFSNKGKTFILTRFLKVDLRENELVFDWASDPIVNQQILASERNVFVCSPGGVKTQFITGQARQVVYEDHPAFAVSLPDQVIKLQRREAFRIRTPVGAPLICQITDHPESPLALEIFDISVGGLALRLPAINTPGFEIGQRYHCVIELRPMGTLDTTLEVRHRLLMKLRTGQEVIRIGCGFLNLPISMETLIQRYVGQLEFERRHTMR